MHRSRRCLVVALGLACSVGGCADDAAPGDAALAADAGEPDSASDASTSDAAASERDADLDAEPDDSALPPERDAGNDASLLDGSCVGLQGDCPGGEDAIDVRGDSPMGPLHLTRAGVSYWNGFTSGTWLWMAGTAGDRAITLVAQVYSSIDPDSDEQCAPGTYTTHADGGVPSPLIASANLCSDHQDLSDVVLEVQTHERDPQALVEPGLPVTFEGTLRVEDPGWSLSAPFAIDRTCDTWASF